MTSGGHLLIGNYSDIGQLVVGGSATLGMQLVTLDQNDTDKPFIDFQGTASANTTDSISTHTTSGATTHHIQVEINGAKAWIAASTNNPSA